MAILYSKGRSCQPVACLKAANNSLEAQLSLLWPNWCKRSCAGTHQRTAPSTFVFYFLLLFTSVWVAWTSYHRAEPLPACEDNYALCSGLIPAGRPLLVSLRRSWAQRVHFQRLITEPLQTEAMHFQSTWLHTSWIYACVVYIYILNAVGVWENLQRPCQQRWHHCGRLPSEHSITIPTSM